jgi:hypothetical protein
MPVRSKFRSRLVWQAGGGALYFRLILGAALFWGASCKKPTPPAPVVKINPDAIHVSAISLGNPRLAIVNGKQRGEGDEVMAAATQLRIVKISDGEVELSSGAQVVLARLATPPKPAAPKR